jgi:hypothetical protein
MARPRLQVRAKEEQPLSISMRKLGVLAIMAALLVVLAALRPTAQTPVAQADLGSPGGITALPSAAPAIPGVANQGIPAIIGTGQPAIVAVFCQPSPASLLPWATGPCSEVQENTGTVDTFGWIKFQLTQVYPTPGAVPGLSFDASGSDSLTVTDNAGADMDASTGLVAVGLTAAAATQGGTQGVNEIVKVTATDETGDVRTVTIVVVDTMLAWGPTGAISTASQEQPVAVSYHCPVTGRAPISGTSATLAEGMTADGDGLQGLDDMYDGLYWFVGPSSGWGSTTLMGDADYADVWCGGNTGSMFDDFVDFTTDKGMFSIDPGAVALQQNSVSLAFPIGYFYPPSLDYDCGEGKNIDTFDIDSLSVWGAFLPFFINASLSPSLEGGCDLDGWRNGVVTTQLLGNGEAGVATITAQQGGGVSPVRTVNVTFEGEAAMSLFITAPASIGLTGDNFTVFLVDQDGRPIGDESVQCTVEPAGGALALLNQTGTTGAIGSGNDGKVTFTLIPTGASVLAGAKLTITCVLDSDRSVKATTDVSLSMTPNLETLDLVEGCNPFAATWPDGTAIDTVAGGVTPADALSAIWKFDPASKSWMGYSPAAPADVNNLASVDRLDAIFICVSAAAKVARPVI